jgi:hypothetical protein
MDLGPLLDAHAYLRVERPPELWEAEAAEEAASRLIEAMIAVASERGTELGEIVLRVNNVTVETPDDQCGDPEEEPRPGDYVALTVLGGQGDWRPEVSWRPGATGDSAGLNDDLQRAAAACGFSFAYVRSSGTGGSVTVFLRRAGQAHAR